MTVLTNWFEGVIQWLEKHCVHPEIIANRETRAYNRLLFYMCLGIGGTRILMLLVMWGLTSDERYAWNALQLHLLTYAGVILKFYPSIYKSAIGLLVIGHLRYYYAFCIVEDPLVSEALSALCIPIVAYYLAGRQAAVWSTLFVAGVLTVFLGQGNTVDLTQSFEPYYFDLISVVWAIVGAGFVASTYQHQRAKYHTELQRQIEETKSLLEQNQRLIQTKQHFIAVSSHEIRNPLSVVLGRLELQHSRESWLNDLERSLYTTQHELNTIMSKIKQTVRLDPIELLVTGDTLGEVMNVVRAQLQSQPFEIVVHQKEAVCHGIPGYRLAYVLLKVLQLNAYQEQAHPVLISYDQPLKAIRIECSEGGDLPSHEQVQSLLAAVNDPGGHFELIRSGSTQFLLKWHIKKQAPSVSLHKTFGLSI